MLPPLLAAFSCFAQEGSQVYISHCIECHSPASASHAPSQEALSQIPWQDILKTLETGAMKIQAQNLTQEERVAAARYLGKAGGAPMLPQVTGFCPAGSRPTVTKASWNGWGVDNLNTRFQPASAAGLTASQIPSLKLKWAFGFPGARTAYGQPNVVGGRVYVGSNDGTIYAIDARTGCLYWMYRAKSMVRSGVVVGPDKRAYVGDLDANLYALDTETGKLIWQKKADDQPFARITGTPKLYNGRLYVPIASQEENAGANPIYPCCKFRGNLVAIDAKTGAVIWRAYTSPEPKPTGTSKTGVQFYGPSGATTWSSPTLDLKRKAIYIMTGNGYSDPNIKDRRRHRGHRHELPVRFAGRNKAVPTCSIGIAARAGAAATVPRITVTMSTSVPRPCCSMSAEASRSWWRARNREWCTRSIPIRTARSCGKRASAKAARWAEFCGGSPATKESPTFHCRTSTARNRTPVVACSRSTRRLAKFSGTRLLPRLRVWPSRVATPPSLRRPARLKAPYFPDRWTATCAPTTWLAGKIIWDFDAAQSFPTTNGIPATGGSFSSTGPTIVDGMLYVNSGYGGQGMPGMPCWHFR